MENDKLVVSVAKVFPYIEQVLEEGQRNMVNESNVDSIGPVLLACNYDLKLLELVADVGNKRIEELQAARAAKPTT